MIEAGTDRAGLGRVVEDAHEQDHERAERVARLLRVLGQQLLGEVCDRERVRTLRTPRPTGLGPPRCGGAAVVVLDDEHAQALEWVVDLVHQDAELLGRRGDRLLEQGQEELVLALEVLVEGPQRLARPLHHLLDGEVLVVRGRHELERRVQEALHALLRAGPSQIQRPGHREVPEGRAVVGGRRIGWHGPTLASFLPVENDVLDNRRSECQTAGSMTMSMLAAPESGTRAWRQASTGNEALISE